MTTDSPLGKLIASLQNKISEGRLDKAAIETATKELAKLGYQYDEDSYPPLVVTESFSNNSSDSPQSLAEALLWKLGKWKAYKRFCENYAAEQPVPTRTNVVFYAFAMHLKDKNSPIYDQHAIRSLWAIFEKLTNDERRKFKSLLFNIKTSGRNLERERVQLIATQYSSNILMAWFRLAEVQASLNLTICSCL